jgi:hypothetical protein
MKQPKNPTKPTPKEDPEAFGILFTEDDYTRLMDSAQAFSALTRLANALPVDDDTNAVMSFATVSNTCLWEFYRDVEERWGTAKEKRESKPVTDSQVPTRENAIPLEMLHEVSDIADSLKASMTVLLEANNEAWNDVRAMLQPLVDRLAAITDRHFPG